MESKVYMFPESSSNTNGLIGMLAPFLQQRGVDPNVLLAMKNNNGTEGSWFMWIIFLFFLMGWGGNGWNRGNGLANEINNDYGRDLLLQAINGNGNAISQLATTLNSDINSVQNAFNALNIGVSNVGNQVGLSGQQVINAIQNGNQQIAAQMAQCCCDNKLLVTNQGFENRIATLEQTNQLGSKVDNGTSSITNAIANQTALINDKFCALEMRDMQSKIDALQEEKSTLQSHINNANQTNQIQSYIASVVNPIAQEVNAIKLAQPATVTLPYSCATAIPTALATQYGLTNYGYWG